jgi:signal transduction histidine kinase
MISKTGTGLGLALVRALSRKHGGDMQIDSIESDGTTVVVTLALTPPSAQAEAA